MGVARPGTAARLASGCRCRYCVVLPLAQLYEGGGWLAIEPM